MGIKYNIIESDFQRNNTSAYQLSILVGVDSLVYSIYDTVSNRLLVLRSCGFDKKNSESIDPIEKLSSIIGQEDLLGPLYRRVKIAFIEPSASLVPSRLYNEQAKATYMDELTSPQHVVVLQVDDIDPLKIKAVYNTGHKEMDLLKTQFPTCRFYNLATPFLLGCHEMLPEDVNEMAFACFEKETFQMAIFDRGELLFYNTFSCKAASDVLYFVLLAFEQNNMDPTVTPLLMAGQVVQDSEIYKTLYRYISEISFMPVPTFVQVGKNAASTDPNFFFHLHSLLLCK